MLSTSRCQYCSAASSSTTHHQASWSSPSKAPTRQVRSPSGVAVPGASFGSISSAQFCARAVGARVRANSAASRTGSARQGRRRCGMRSSSAIRGRAGPVGAGTVARAHRGRDGERTPPSGGRHPPGPARSRRMRGMTARLAFAVSPSPWRRRPRRARRPARAGGGRGGAGGGAPRGGARAPGRYAGARARPGGGRRARGAAGAARPGAATAVGRASDVAAPRTGRAPARPAADAVGAGAAGDGPRPLRRPARRLTSARPCPRGPREPLRARTPRARCRASTAPRAPMNEVVHEQRSRSPGRPGRDRSRVHPRDPRPPHGAAPPGRPRPRRCLARLRPWPRDDARPRRVRHARPARPGFADVGRRRPRRRCAPGRAPRGRPPPRPRRPVGPRHLRLLRHDDRDARRLPPGRRVPRADVRAVVVRPRGAPLRVDRLRAELGVRPRRRGRRRCGAVPRRLRRPRGDGRGRPARCPHGHLPVGRAAADVDDGALGRLRRPGAPPPRSWPRTRAPSDRSAAVGTPT